MSDVRWGEGAGARLKAARQDQGLDLGLLAAQLKVPASRLEALEAGDWQALPDGPYARGLAKAVCRVLHLPAEPVLSAMPDAASNALERVSVGLNQPFREGGATAAWPRWAAGLGVLVVLAVAVVLWWAPQWATMPWPSAEQASGVVTAEVQEATSASAQVQPQAFEPTAAASSPRAAASPTALASTPEAPAPSVSGTAGSAPTASSPPAQPTTDTRSLRIVAQQDTWLSVVDGRGQSLVARLVPAGEVVAMEPIAPVRITLGNAPGARLEWRGQVQDLSAYAQARVARLELQ